MRIRLELPEQFSFHTTIPIRITDVNYGGHVGNDSILSLIHEARLQYLNSFGYTEMELEGVALIMSDAAIEFKSELFYGDQLKVYITVSNYSKVSFDLFYKLVNSENEKIIVTAKTGMVCYDYKNKKVTTVPEAAKMKLK
ncbi:MAG TPA: thioesterase family protein [Flavisolibacter sp.]|nr:thioesterase family protein [Flavisolibacter sp.]